MKEGPDIAQIAAQIAALTATELAHEAGVTKQTASSHLAQLTNGDCWCAKCRAATIIFA